MVLRDASASKKCFRSFWEEQSEIKAFTLFRKVESEIKMLLGALVKNNITDKAQKATLMKLQDWKMVCLTFGASLMFINIDKHKHRLLSVLYFTKKKKW